MKILKIDHLGIAVNSIDGGKNFWSEVLGLEFEGAETVEEQKVTTAFFPVGESEVELLESTSPDGPVAKFIEKRGQGFQHVAFRVENIEAAVNGIRGLGICGVSVTIPHKIAVMQHLDKVDPMAAQIGAVNTILNRDGVLHGFNSDSTGAVKAIAETTAIKSKEVAVIGAGGAACAIGFGLKQEGAIVTIINRTELRGEKLARDLECRFIPLADLKELPFDVVVNATSAGMTPDINSMPLASELLTPEMIVMDIVYNPLKTRFLQEAENIGCTTIDGVAMFVHQGAVQFELWTSHKAPVDIMRKVVLESLIP
jgi:shikimate dehydrogenase